MIRARPLSLPGRSLHGEEQLRPGRAAALHLGGVLQRQSVQHPHPLRPGHSAVRSGTGEERGGGVRTNSFFLSEQIEQKTLKIAAIKCEHVGKAEDSTGQKRIWTEMNQTESVPLEPEFISDDVRATCTCQCPLRTCSCHIVL